jgi:hypothetical protein
MNKITGAVTSPFTMKMQIEITLKVWKTSLKRRGVIILYPTVQIVKYNYNLHKYL